MTHFITRLFAQPRHIVLGGMVTLAIATTAITPAFAGGKHKHKMNNMTEQERLEHMEDRLDKKMEHLTEELALSDAQAKSVRVILSGSHTERLDIKARHDNKRDAKPEHKALKARTQDELKRVLTAAQFAQFEAIQQERREHKKARREEGRMEHLKTQLALSDVQVSQIEALHIERKSKAKALIQTAGSREAARPDLKALRDGSEQEVRALLTSSQQIQFDAMKADRPKKDCKGK